MAARIFDHRRETNSPCPVDSQARHLIHFQRGLQSVARPARSHLNAGRAYLGCSRAPASVAIEPICCPLCRGRKVEFVIVGAGRSSDECLETRVPPKLNCARCRSCRNTYIAYAAGHQIGQDQTAGARMISTSMCVTAEQSESG